MSTGYLVIVAAAWVTIGLAVGYLMRRRGHDFFVWLVLGVGLGPLVVPLAIERARFHSAAEGPLRTAPTPPHRGVDLLAGIDGSDESIAAIRSALDLFGDKVTSLTLVTVLDYDSEASPAGAEAREEARAMLDRVSDEIDYKPVFTEVQFGRADKALAEYARTGGMELVVVGSRGHGATEAMFGSITARLVGECVIPVFVGPTPGHIAGGSGSDAASAGQPG